MKREIFWIWCLFDFINVIIFYFPLFFYNEIEDDWLNSYVWCFQVKLSNNHARRAGPCEWIHNQAKKTVNSFSLFIGLSHGVQSCVLIIWLFHNFFYLLFLAVRLRAHRQQQGWLLNCSAQSFHSSEFPTITRLGLWSMP